jgi:hypothetical protein
MSYIGNAPISAAFLTDTFSGNGSTVAFTMTVAPANTSSIIVAITGVLQDPSTYSVSGTTLTFSAAPPSGTSNISVRYLGIPASGVTTTAYRTITEFTATSGQTSFSVPSYTVGYIDVYRNGVMLGTADFTATTGTTVVLATGATTGDLIRTESFYVSSVLNAIPNNNYGVTRANMPAGSVLQLVQGTFSTQTSLTGTTLTATGLTATISPSSATSKILVQVYIPAFNSSNAANAYFYLYKNGSNLSQLAYFQGGSSTVAVAYTAVYFDSPATTSATTYAIYAATAAGATMIWAFGNLQSNITLTEISV